MDSRLRRTRQTRYTRAVRTVQGGVPRAQRSAIPGMGSGAPRPEVTPVERQQCEILFLGHLAWLERTAMLTCRRHGVHGADAEDFASWVKLRMIQDDYAVLRKFRGESSIRTYMVSVIKTFFRQHRTRCWGCWRPSTRAQQLGPTAVRLEALVYRDGCPLNQAMQILRSTIGEGLSDRQLHALFRALPHRTHARRPEIPDVPLDIPDSSAADDLVACTEGELGRTAVERRLARALAQLASHDRIIIQMYYWEGRSVADIARALGLPQKPLYRQLPRALAQLRRHLEGTGVLKGDALAFLDDRAA
jgi:RNA polymerase sigma factor (sigma-70 family)